MNKKSNVSPDFNSHDIFENVEFDERTIQMLNKMKEAMARGADDSEIIKIFGDFLSCK